MCVTSVNVCVCVCVCVCNASAVVQVREHFYNMLGMWLTQLPDRYDFEVRVVATVAVPVIALACSRVW